MLKEHVGFYDLPQREQFALRYQAVVRHGELICATLQQFNKDHSAEEIDGNPKKRIPPNRQLRLMRELLWVELRKWADEEVRMRTNPPARVKVGDRYVTDYELLGVKPCL